MWTLGSMSCVLFIPYSLLLSSVSLIEIENLWCTNPDRLGCCFESVIEYFFELPRKCFEDSQEYYMADWAIIVRSLKKTFYSCGILNGDPDSEADNLRISAGIFKQSVEVRNRVGIGLPYRLHRLAELIPWNCFLGSLKVLKFGLWSLSVGYHYTRLSS